MMEQHYNGIVIGAGLGGLTAAAELAGKGLRMLVLDQHTAPGGAATSFKRGDFIYEAGLHMTASNGKDRDFHHFFETTGIKERIHFVPAPEFYHIYGPGFSFVFGNDLADSIQRLKTMFPAERAAIDKYFRRIFSISDCALKINQSRGIRRFGQVISSPFIFTQTLISMFGNIGNFLDHTFKDERLKIILLANIGYYDDDPYDLSLLFFAIAQSGYYRNGGHYIQGGSRQLADTMAEYIIRKGGAVLTGRQVTKILTDKNGACGVEFVKGTGPDKGPEKERVFAPLVIANAAIPRVLNALLDTSVARQERKKIRKLEVGPSILSLYIALDKPLKELGNAFYSSCFYDSRPFTIREMAELHHADFEWRPFILCDYSQIDSRLCSPNNGFAVLSMFDYYKDWSGLPEIFYRRKKEAVKTTLMERLYRHFPQLHGHVLRTEVATAKTMERYLQTPEGTAYGFSQKARQALLFRPGPRSSVKNLYYASAWTMPGGGFGGAMSSGKICADAVIKDLGITNPEQYAV
ncbi:MAG: NAD(P)/FAD-dependent oxidoreductase [Candidatus Marinimicrobia bacterium]|nr:NAD(P)/FAD-dependent oxidoreductase [Candidatus Neomarinimicrobiota bacterium]